MHRLKIYIDTSVIGGCFDDEFSEWSNKLFDEFIEGKKIAEISETTIEELANAPNYIKEKINEIPDKNILFISKDEDTEFLSSKYIELNVISKKYINDAIHIAIAVVNKIDVLVSWNFKHIVNLDRIRKYNSVNIMYGYNLLEIRNPKEVISNEEI